MSLERLQTWWRDNDNDSRVVVVVAVLAAIAGAGGFVFGDLTVKESLGLAWLVYMPFTLCYMAFAFWRLYVGGPSRAAVGLAPRADALNLLPLTASAAMLFLAASDDWPRGFYQMLRVVVCASAAYVAVQTSDHRRAWPWLMGAIAVLFNPVVPVTFSQQDWQPIDFGVGVVFVAALVQEVMARARRK